MRSRPDAGFSLVTIATSRRTWSRVEMSASSRSFMEFTLHCKVNQKGAVVKAGVEDGGKATAYPLFDFAQGRLFGNDTGKAKKSGGFHFDRLRVSMTETDNGKSKRDGFAVRLEPEFPPFAIRP